MGRARQLASKGNNFSLTLDSTDFNALLLNRTDLSVNDAGDNVLLDGTDGSATDAGFRVELETQTTASETDTNIGERLVLNGTNDASLDAGFSILQEDENDNPDIEVTSFIDPSDTLIFTSPPKIETNPSFKVFLSANDSNSHGAFSKINFDLVGHDIGGFYDTSNFRYQPTIPGYYRFFLSTYTGSAVDVYAILTLIYKNGLGYQSGGLYSRLQMSGLTNDDLYATALDVSEILYMDGTDYIEGYSYQASEDGQAVSVFGNTVATTMSGYLVARSTISPQKGNTL